MLDWTEVDRAGESVVDHRDEAVSPGELDDCFMVSHLKQRIRHRLNIDGLRIGPPFLLPRLRVVAVDEIVGYAERVEIFCDKVVGPTVQAILDEQVIPIVEER